MSSWYIQALKHQIDNKAHSYFLLKELKAESRAELVLRELDHYAKELSHLTGFHAAC